MARLKHRLRPVGLEFLDSAPVRLVFSLAVAASPEAVYRALAEETGSWPEWFGAVRRARDTRTGRYVVLAGGAAFEETVLVAEAPRRYAYRTDAMNRPGVKALLEEWRVEPVGRSSLVQWTVVAEPTRTGTALLRVFAPALRRSFRAAMRKLDERGV
ncbi:SRPBCC family protein [Streptomyces polygonati]|uniref:SRPBCC family protein n=1 Tax=Streptomyces polygonati TaxID=1617087 RepID=A0ABV8HHT8_9ACTN